MNKNSRKTKILILILIMALMATSVAFGVGATNVQQADDISPVSGVEQSMVVPNDTPQISVSTWEQIRQAILGMSINSALHIVVTEDITTTEQAIIIPIGRTIYISGNKTLTFNRTQGVGSENCHFIVRGTLYIDNITLTSTATPRIAGGIRSEAGRVYMYRGATITNNGNNSSGGGVWIGNYSVFTMYGGVISNNITTHDGGGVYVMGSGSVFTMYGGTISGNTSGPNSGGVHVNAARFDMINGTIINNATSFSAGGVGLFHNATLNMTDGNISGNTSSGGSGGVHVENSTFTMDGGNIFGNTILTSNGGGWGGGGVTAIADSVFEMNGGYISGNSSRWLAGGVYVIFGATFTMNDGVVSNNTAVNAGGGLGILDANFIMNGGEISGNLADYGGGFWVSDGTAEITNGTIAGNRAVYDGGGIFYQNFPVNYEVPLVSTDYAGLTIEEDAVFLNNTAGNGAFVPHESVNLITGIATSNASIFSHPLNNFDINFRHGEPHFPGFATIIKELVTPEGTPIPEDMAFHFDVDFVSWNEVTPTDSSWPTGVTPPTIPTAYIPVTGDGTTVDGVTTRIMTGDILPADWHTTGLFIFRVTEQQNVAPHTLGAGENMIFSDAEFLMHVYVARCPLSGVAYPQEVQFFVVRYDEYDSELYETIKVNDIIFVNAYTVDADEGLVVTKTVVGDFADTNFPFQFAITVTLDEIFEVDTFVGVIRNRNGSIVDTVTFTNGVEGTFTLAHGWSITFADIPVGTQFSVVETYVPGYVTTIAVTGVVQPIDGLDAGTHLVQELGSTAAFTNEFDTTPGTGLNIGNASIIGLVLLAFGSLGAFVVVKAKKARA